VRDLRGHAVQLEDRDVLTAHERLAGRDTKIETPEAKALESSGYVVDRTLERWCQQRTRVVEACAAAVAPAVAERNTLRRQRHLAQTVGLLSQMKERHADRVRVFENEFLERAASVANNRWQPLLGDRQDAAARVARPTDVEHPELDAGHVLLNDCVNVCV
jgi:hypothetical protein